MYKKIFKIVQKPKINIKATQRLPTPVLKSYVDSHFLGAGYNMIRCCFCYAHNNLNKNKFKIKDNTVLSHTAPPMQTHHYRDIWCQTRRDGLSFKKLKTTCLITQIHKKLSLSCKLLHIKFHSSIHLYGLTVKRENNLIDVRICTITLQNFCFFFVTFVFCTFVFFFNLPSQYRDLFLILFCFHFVCYSKIFYNHLQVHMLTAWCDDGVLLFVCPKCNSYHCYWGTYTINTHLISLFALRGGL